ncbi:MAG: DUF3256 family protein, partial [Tannerellaceae bacterium]|nr:DUF3256 family protein [Tannerellaceae bacterium]
MKRFFLLLIIYTGVWGAKAQDMAALFIEIPDACLPSLESAWRKDLVDLYHAGKEAQLQNTMMGYSKLLTLTPDYLELRLTERSVVEMKILPLINHTHIICMVTTVDAPVSDSRIEFYTTQWQPLDASEMFTPVTADWFIIDDADRESDAFKDALSRMDIDLIKYRLSPD